MGASFRNVGEILELAGCDLLTISPKLLAELNSTEAELPRKLDPSKSVSMEIEQINIDKAKFDEMHATDKMASEKLAEGIQGFTKALESLEQILTARLARLAAGDVVVHAAEGIFHAYDLDGDGFITREEWLGTDAVFDALDEDHDGKISPQEMGAGLGAVLQLAQG